MIGRTSKGVRSARKGRAPGGGLCATRQEKPIKELQMKKCPYCAEEVQDQAVVCKHCKSNLASSPTVATTTQTNTLTKRRTISPKTLKWVGIGIAILVAIPLFYISTPLAIIWYIWKKKKLNPKWRIGVTGALGALMIFALVIVLTPDKQPALAITEPKTGTELQAKTVTVKGTVDPTSSKVTVNGVAVKADHRGNFSYDAPLNDEQNNLNIVATNGSKRETQKLTIKRIFTPEELAEREQQKEAAAKAQAEAQAKTDQEKNAKATEVLQRELGSFNKPFDSSNYRGDVTKLQMEVVLFGAWAKLVNEYKAYNDPQVKQLAAELEKKASTLQAREFPAMRKAYGEVVGKGLWESNVDVNVYGSGNKTIELVGALFANNKNVGQAQAQIGDAIKMFRFTRVNYKWFKYDDEYNYYNLEVPADSTVVEIQ